MFHKLAELLAGERDVHELLGVARFVAGNEALAAEERRQLLLYIAARLEQLALSEQGLRLVFGPEDDPFLSLSLERPLEA